MTLSLKWPVSQEVPWSSLKHNPQGALTRQACLTHSLILFTTCKNFSISLDLWPPFSLPFASLAHLPLQLPKPCGVLYYCNVCSLPWWSVAKNPPAADTGDGSSIPGSGRSPGGGHGSPLQYSGLENLMDRGLGGPRGSGSQKNRTWLSD